MVRAKARFVSNLQKTTKKSTYNSPLRRYPADKPSYWRFIWLDASSVTTAKQGLVDIGRQNGVAEPSVVNVKSWLACQSQRWLLIIDNADNPDVDYSEYMPPSKRGDILFTTRNSDCLIYQTAGSETLHGLEPESARELLFKATTIPQSQWEDEEDAARAVVETLESHTLAIIQAGAFIRRGLCTLEEYPTLFKQQKRLLLEFHSKQNMSTYRNVYATFEVSAKHLQDSHLPEASDALDLLHIIAFMHNREVSERLFQRASEYASEVKDMGTRDDEEVLSLSKCHIARLPEYIQERWSSPQKRLRWREACAMLTSLSLITVHKDDNSLIISVHSLVHAWAKERQDHQIRCTAWQSAATILALSCKGWYSFCPFFTYLQPHVRACVSNEIENLTEHTSDMEAAQKLFQLAYVLYRTRDESSLRSLIQRIRFRLQNKSEDGKGIKNQVNIFTARISLDQGNFKEAVHIFKIIVDVNARTLAKNHPSRLASQHELASAYTANGQIDQAVTLLEHVVNIKGMLAEDHPSRLVSQHELASAYEANGQIDEAVILLEHVVRIREKLAEDHPDRLASQHELAGAYRANGQIYEAVKLLEYVVKVREKLAEDHPSRLASQHQLAIAYEANGQIDKAVELLEHVVRIREKLAEDHPSRLASQHQLAIAYEANGQIDEAVILLEHVVRIREKLAEDHPDRLASQNQLAATYEANGQIDKAVELLEHVVKIEEKLAEDHPSRLTSQHELALAYRANGQTHKAVELLEHVVKVREKLAEDHPSRLTSQYELASAYNTNGKIDKAVILLEHVVKIEEKLAEDHPSRLASQHQLAATYEANGQIDKAVELLEHVVKIEEKLAEDHPSRLASQHTLAIAYEANGQIDEAVILLEHVVRIREKLAEDHPSRLVSQHQLAIAYRANGQIDKAVELLEYVVKIKKKLAEDHPSRLASQYALASVYRANGRVAEAEKLTSFDHRV